MNPPEINNIENITIPKCDFIDLSGIPCYVIQGGTQAIVKLQLTFPAGRKYETKPAQSRMANVLLKEGCADFEAEEFAHNIDNYGFSLKVSSDLDNAYITLICLNQFFEHGFNLIKSMLAAPLYKQSEIDRFASISSQNLKAQLDKNELICYRTLTKNLFGDNHIYGYNTEPESYFEVERDDLVRFHSKNYDFSKMKVFLSGQVTDEIIGQLDFGVKGYTSSFDYQQPVDQQAKNQQIAGKQKLQTSIKTGKRLFSRQHPDYCDMYILNNILGGYFGSRLMRNIREDKGYTYNVYSLIDNMMHDGYLSINCEVSNTYRDQTLDEIWKELERLKTDLVPKEEMRMVRNYMMGQLMHGLDGPLASSELFSSLISNGLDEQFLHKMIDRTKFITTFDIRSTAQKYLKIEDFTTIVVGN